MFARYLGEIGSVGQDIARLYRHFVDWNLKKLFVLVYFGGTALLLSVPFAVLVLVIGYNYPDLVANLAALAAGVNAGRPVSDFLDAVAASAVPVAGIVLAIGGIVSAFLFASVYSVTLLSRIYLGYVRGERTRIASLPLLSWPLAKRVVGVFAWQGLWLLAGLVAVVLAFASARWILGIESSLFYGICAVVVAAVLAYVIVRMSLVFGALAQDTETGGWRLARESWSTFAGWR